MAQNGIQTAGVRKLVAALCRSPKLEYLDLGDNTVRFGGGKMVARLLRSCKDMRGLYLESVLLRDKGGRAVAAALAEGALQLEELNLSYNEMPKAVCDVLVAANLATKCPKLKQGGVSVSGNGFGDAGEAALQAQLGDRLAEVEDNEEPDELEVPSGEDTDYDDEGDEGLPPPAMPGGGGDSSASGGAGGAPGSTEQLHVTIKPLAATTPAFELLVEATMTVADLKALLHSEPQSAVQLIFAGLQLEDDRTLKSYGVSNRSVLHSLGSRAKLGFDSWWTAAATGAAPDADEQLVAAMNSAGDESLFVNK